MAAITLPNLAAIASHFRNELQTKKIVLLYAYNGTGKTRLSTAFKDITKRVDDAGITIARDTLYFNAFTEDLFQWENDLETDRDRCLKLNTESTLFEGLETVELETRVRRILSLFADFQFRIDVEEWTIHFSREVLREIGGVLRNETVDGIKISRSEESIFIWCFFIALLEIALDEQIEVYKWVDYVYIDDPISSLDEQNAALVAVHLAQVLKGLGAAPRIVVSTHHALFYHILWSELRGVSAKKYFLGYNDDSRTFQLEEQGDTPFFHHVAELIRLYQASVQGTVERRHFNTLRAIAERTASFHGYGRFEDCIGAAELETHSRLYRRFLSLYSHGGYSHFDADGLQDEDKQHFRNILNELLRRFSFNETYFPGLEQ